MAIANCIAFGTNFHSLFCFFFIELTNNIIFNQLFYLNVQAYKLRRTECMRQLMSVCNIQNILCVRHFWTSIANDRHHLHLLYDKFFPDKL